MNKRVRMIVIVVLALVVLSAGGYYVYSTYVAPAQTAEEAPAVQTALVRQGDIEIVASGVGEFVAATEVDLSFSSSGILTVLNVRVGEKVQAGAVLAQLGELSNLEAGVTSAQLSVLEYEQALQGLYDNHALDLANAQLALVQATSDLQDANYYYQSSQPGYRGSAADYSATYASYILALQQLERAETNFNRVSSLSESNPQRAQALASYEAAKQNVDSYLSTLSWYEGGPSDNEQAELLANIAIAQANVDLAAKQVAILTEGPDPDEVVLAEARLSQARANLQSAQDGLAGATLVAPFAGTILAINGQVGETAGSSFITLANLEQRVVQIYLDESDFDKIDLDYPVEVVFDAIPDLTYTGHVIQVDPVLSTEGNTSVVTGLVQLDNADDLLARLPLGSNASVVVYSARVQDAILVPVEALREIDSSTYGVFVMEDGEPVMRIVEVGLIDITYAEVLSGLQPGDTVTTGIVETQP